MRKYGLYLLIAVSLMTGCQKKDTVTVDTAAETTQESSETGLKAESEPESTAENLSGTDQNGNTDVDARADRFAPIPIAVNADRGPVFRKRKRRNPDAYCKRLKQQ